MEGADEEGRVRCRRRDDGGGMTGFLLLVGQIDGSLTSLDGDVLSIVNWSERNHSIGFARGERVCYLRQRPGLDTLIWFCFFWPCQSRINTGQLLMLLLVLH